MKTFKYIPFGFNLGLLAGIVYGAVANNMIYGVSFGILLGLTIVVVVGSFMDYRNE